MSRVSNRATPVRRKVRWVLLQLGLMLSIGLSVYYRYDLFPTGRAEKLIAGLTSHSVTIMSILVAAGAILMSIASTRLIRNLVKTRHYHRLVDSLLISIVLFLASATIGIIAMYLPANYEQICLTVISSCFAISLVSFADTGWKLYSVLSALHKRPSN